jgi:hypothetical protein
MDKLETSSDDARASKKRTDLFGCRIGGDVKVFGFESNDQVPYGTTHDVGLIALVLQNLAYLDRMARNDATIYAVFFFIDPS